MAISWTADGAYAAEAPSNPITISSASLGNGDIYLFLYAELYNGATSDISLTINGVSATQVGSSLTIGNDAAMVWKVAANSGATGNIVISTTAGTWAGVAANWFVITGEGTPVLTTFDSNFAQADPQGPVTGTVTTGGLAVVSFLVNQPSGTPLPVTWAGATTAGSGTEAYSATGNTIGCSMASVTAGGAASVTAEGTGADTGFTNSAMLMLAFPAGGGGGGNVSLASIAVPRKIFLAPKKKFYFR